MEKREKVTFADNVPTAVILAGVGLPQANAAGETEFRYFLEGYKIMWLPPEAHDQIVTARAGEGSELLITKQRQKRGAPVRWAVEHIADEPGAAAELRNTTSAPSSRAPIPIHQPPTPANGHKPPARPAPTPAPQPAAEQPLTAADRLAAALADAVDVAAEATTYARDRGITLAWQAGDIRAMAATLFIQGTH